MEGAPHAFHEPIIFNAININTHMTTRQLEPMLEKEMFLSVVDKELTTQDWIEQNKSKVESLVSKNGVLLIRGLTIPKDEFSSILTNLFGEELVSYKYRSTPRTELKNNIYTATEYHSEEEIPQHNENAYSNTWPTRIGFVCKVKATEMGNTPLSDSRVAYGQIPIEIREEFERKHVMYVRNYGSIDLPWTEVFQTEDKAEVEAYCKKNHLDFEWLSGGLRTKQTNQATAIHPVTQDKLWFNQAHLFHYSNLKEDLRDGLIELFGEENLPRNAYFGDGSPIDPEYLSVIRKVYNDTKFSFDWEENDLLLLDNMLFTHGREPYKGDREVLVGMARVHDPENIASVVS